MTEFLGTDGGQIADQVTGLTAAAEQTGQPAGARPVLARAQLARGLAARRINLVLVARREAPMRQLAAEFEKRWGVRIVVEVLDLAQPASAATLQQRLERQGIEPEILINNAGCGIGSLFVEHDAERLRAMLQLDVVTLTELALVFGRRMAARGKGLILLVGSTAAYQPTPMTAAYGAAALSDASFWNDQNWVASVWAPVGTSSSVAVNSVMAERNTRQNAAARPGTSSGTVTLAATVLVAVSSTETVFEPVLVT